MDKRYCKNCAHYHQHYALNKRKIFRVYCGHCMQHRVRQKLPDAIACDDFVPTLPDEDALLQKNILVRSYCNIYNLELLPTIEYAEKTKQR